MSIISAVREYIKGCLPAGSPVWIEYLGRLPGEYSVEPLPGGRVVEAYVDGSSVREYLFVIKASISTADDLVRLQANEAFEDLAALLEQQTEAGDLPTLDAGLIAERVEAVSWGSLFEQGSSGTGIYMVQCRLLYQQQPA